jgi:glutamyl-tRNA reductase
VAAAAQLAREVFGELAGRHILIIGAGKMGELAAGSLVSGGVENVFIANRTLERAAALAARFGGRAVAFERLGAELERADVVVASTSCPRLIVSADQVASALVRRRGRPLLLIDIAVPRDLDPAIGELAGCSLYNVDDLGAVGESRADTRAEFSRAEAIAAEEAGRFLAWRRSLEVVPAITSLRRRAEEIRADELERANAKLGALSTAERRAVEAVTAQIVNKLLHAPTVRVKEAAERPDGALYAAALRHLFALEEVA